MIRDNDRKFGRHVTILPKSPNLNAICERFLDGPRRECLDQFLTLGEEHLGRVLVEWVRHFNDGRPHQALGQRTPSQPRLPERPEPGAKVVAFSVIGGLHHDYRWAA